MGIMVIFIVMGTARLHSSSFLWFVFIGSYKVISKSS